MINSGADISSKDNNGYKPLHYAAQYGKTEMASLLISNGADINSKCNVGDTPLHLASKGYIDTASILISSGADINAKNNNGTTSLHYAIENGQQTEIALLLISNGADINIQNDDGKTARDCLTEFHQDIFEILESPLHYVIERNRIKEASLLINKGTYNDTKDVVSTSLYKIYDNH